MAHLLMVLLIVATAAAGASLEWASQPGHRSAALDPAPGKAGFTLMRPQRTDLAFTNRIPPERHYTNQILLNGSGVAAGDVDGDGRCDLFFAALGGESSLYRNRGDWKFEEMTGKADLTALSKLDATGTALADLDGDTDLDLIVNSVG